jgi:guanylate kinase
MQRSLHHALLDKVRDYQVPDRAVALLNQHPPLVIAGVTASGKTDIMDLIQESSDWRHVITHTTRSVRAGEIDGQNYWFVSEDEMLQLLERQAMIEANAVHGETVYGTSLAAYETVLKNGHQSILIMDVQGIEDTIQRVASLRPFFLLPPSFEEWMRRLDQRGHMSHVERSRRLQSAKDELSIALKNDRFILVVNNEISATAQTILKGVTDQLSQRRNRELAQLLIDHINSY